MLLLLSEVIWLSGVTDNQLYYLFVQELGLFWQSFRVLEYGPTTYVGVKIT